MSNLNYKSKLTHYFPDIWIESSSLILLRKKLVVGIGLENVIQINLLARALIQHVI